MSEPQEQETLQQDDDSPVTPVAVPASRTDGFRNAATLTVTLLLFLIVGLWLILVATKIGAAPERDRSGALLYDPYGRAKDILIILLPLLTTAVGYWLGAQGTTQAQQQAAVATKTAADAQAHAHAAGVREKLAYAASDDPQLYAKALSLARDPKSIGL